MEVKRAGIRTKRVMIAKYLLGLLLGLSSSIQAEQRSVGDIVKRVEMAAPISEVFSAFSSNDGVQTFFSRGSNVDFKPGGDYEILFFPDREAGQRGAEDTKILAIESGRRISIIWNAPPVCPNVRNQRTVVSFSFKPVDEQTTEVMLRQGLWAQGEEWFAANEYFQKAWDVVLYRLQHRFQEGPVNWDNPPRPS